VGCLVKAKPEFSSASARSHACWRACERHTVTEEGAGRSPTSVPESSTGADTAAGGGSTDHRERIQTSWSNFGVGRNRRRNLLVLISNTNFVL
jgi:hypothetical protein